MAFQARSLQIEALSIPSKLVIAVLFSMHQMQPFYHVLSAKLAALPKGRKAASGAYPLSFRQFRAIVNF